MIVVHLKIRIEVVRESCIKTIIFPWCLCVSIVQFLVLKPSRDVYVLELKNLDCVKTFIGVFMCQEFQ